MVRLKDFWGHQGHIDSFRLQHQASVKLNIQILISRQIHKDQHGSYLSFFQRAKMVPLFYLFGFLFFPEET